MIHNVQTVRAPLRHASFPAAGGKAPLENRAPADFQRVLKHSQNVTTPAPAGTTASHGLTMYTAAGNGPSAAAPPAVASATQPIGSGSLVRSDGGVTYSAANNQYLQTSPTVVDLLGNVIPANSNYYATPQAANQFAKAFGGTVVADSNCMITAGSMQWAIRLPNGKTVNAGTIGQILGNDVAYPNDRSKSAALASAFGLSWRGENFAACARAGETIANATAAPVANPSALAGEELAYYQAHQPNLT